MSVIPSKVVVLFPYLASSFILYKMKYSQVLQILTSFAATTAAQSAVVTFFDGHVVIPSSCSNAPNNYQSYVSVSTSACKGAALNATDPYTVNIVMDAAATSAGCFGEPQSIIERLC
jgi:prepilin-type processing-associated H-X9-DG protein